MKGKEKTFEENEISDSRLIEDILKRDLKGDLEGDLEDKNQD